MSDETKWTKGPWRVQTMKNGIEHEILHGEYYVATSFGGCTGEGRPGANAHLIAAAPDLYAMLEDALEKYGYEGFDGDDYDMYVAALAKARGES